MEKLKNITIQFKYRDDGASYVFTEEDAKTLIEKFKEDSKEVITFADKDKKRNNVKIHIKLNTVGIIEEEEGGEEGNCD